MAVAVGLLIACNQPLGDDTDPVPDTSGDSDTDPVPAIDLAGHWIVPFASDVPVAPPPYVFVSGGNCRIDDVPVWWEEDGTPVGCHDWPDARQCTTMLSFVDGGALFWQARFSSPDCDGREGIMRADLEVPWQWSFVDNDGELDLYDVGPYGWEALRLSDALVSVEVQIADDFRVQFGLSRSEPFPN